MNEINICFICDEKYAVQTAVAIYSIKKVKDLSTVYNIYILGDELTDNSITLLKNLTDNNFFVNILTIDHNEFSNLQIQNIHVSKAALCKFYIARIFSKLDKILYLDSDIIVKKDLKSLFNNDISNFYAAVVKDYKAMKYNPPQTVKLKINHKAYFNSGVMLLNLEKIRNDKLEEKLINYRFSGINYFMDQDALNVIFKEKVKYISFLNNVILSVLGSCSIKEINKYYKLKGYNYLSELYNDAVIIHLASPYKPWIYDNVPFTYEWNKLYREISKKPLVLKHLNLLNKKRAFGEIENYKDRRDYGVDIPIIVSLTTYPKRINTVYEVVNTLFRQTIKPDKIVLWLAKEQFPFGKSSLPKTLLELESKGLYIEWCDDIGAHKKYYYAMLRFDKEIIITVDDDVFYPDNLVENLLISYIKYPYAVSARRVHLINFDDDKILPYKEWHYCYTKFKLPSMALIATGVGGVLYPPGILNKETFNKTNIKSLALKGDDLWLKVMEVISNVPVVCSEMNCNLNFIEGTQDDALWRDNVYANGNDIQFKNILNFYNDYKKNDSTVVNKIKLAYENINILEILDDNNMKRNSSFDRNNYFIYIKIISPIKLCQKLWKYYRVHGLKNTFNKISEKIKY